MFSVPTRAILATALTLTVGLSAGRAQDPKPGVQPMPMPMQPGVQPMPMNPMPMNPVPMSQPGAPVTGIVTGNCGGTYSPAHMPSMPGSYPSMPSGCTNCPAVDPCAPSAPSPAPFMPSPTPFTPAPVQPQFNPAPFMPAPVQPQFNPAPAPSPLGGDSAILSGGDSGGVRPVMVPIGGDTAVLGGGDQGGVRSFGSGNAIFVRPSSSQGTTSVTACPPPKQGLFGGCFRNLCKKGGR